jgi:adenine-specific DNA-methyltransferase
VRAVYIDPPYNTGKDLSYQDHMMSHEEWCAMMEPRLALARVLLHEDGVIFISIDDGERARLRLLCDAIFGEENFICEFLWEKTQHFGRQKLNYYSNAEYILCFAKALYAGGGSGGPKLKELLVERVKTELLDAPLFNASNREAALTFPPGTVLFHIPDGVYERAASEAYTLLDPVTVAGGYNEGAFSLRFRSRWSNETVQKEIENGTRFLVKTEGFAIRAVYGAGKSSRSAPRQILFTNQGNPLCTKGRLTKRIDTTENASRELKKLFGTEVFSYPKPVSLIEYLISLVFDPAAGEHPRDFLVLDFFAGSATTAHAVLSLNAKDGGARRFILVQRPEPTPEGSAARAAGYGTIAEVGKARIRLAGGVFREINLTGSGI